MGLGRACLFDLMERFKEIHVSLIQVRGGKSCFILGVVLCNTTAHCQTALPRQVWISVGAPLGIL